MILAAPYTQFPTVIRILGVLGLVAAVGLPLIGWDRIDRLMAWFQQRPVNLLRTWLLLGVLVGGFLIYAVL